MDRKGVPVSRLEYLSYAGLCSKRGVRFALKGDMVQGLGSPYASEQTERTAVVARCDDHASRIPTPEVLTANEQSL